MENDRSEWKRKLGVLLFCIAALATLVGGGHLFENWRGKDKWQTYKRELTKRGVKVDLAQFIPPPIPDEQNFAAVPYFQELFPKPKTNTNPRWPDTFADARNQVKGSTPKGRQVTDFGVWRVALKIAETNPPTLDRKQAATEVLEALAPYQAVIEELRAASVRPYSRYPVRYDMENPWGILLPHLSRVKGLAEVMNLQACAKLAMGNTEGAMQDFRLIMRLVNSLDTEPFLISYLVRIAAFQIGMQTLWEGLALGTWSDAQLEELQRIALQFNFVQDVQNPLGAEQAAGILTADLILKQRYKADFLNALIGGTRPSWPYLATGNIMAMFVPRGWYHMEQYQFARIYQEFVLPGGDGTNRVIDPNVITNNNERLVQEIKPGWQAILQHRFLSGLLIPAVGRTQTKAAQAQTAAHQAAIACALERYRRRHGEYPMELAKLAPEFMDRVPHDVIGGQPMRYKPGKPLALYSVAWDGKDNGGAPGKVLWDDRGGDWVWSYPN